MFVISVPGVESGRYKTLKQSIAGKEVTSFSFKTTKFVLKKSIGFRS